MKSSILKKVMLLSLALLLLCSAIPLSATAETEFTGLTLSDLIQAEQLSDYVVKNTNAKAAEPTIQNNRLVFDTTGAGGINTFYFKTAGDSKQAVLNGYTVDMKLELLSSTVGNPYLVFGFYQYDTTAATAPENAGCYLQWWLNNGNMHIYKKNSEKAKETVKENASICKLSAGNAAYLRIVNDESAISFYYSVDGRTYALLGSASLVNMWQKGYLSLSFRQDGKYAISELNIYKGVSKLEIGGSDSLVDFNRDIASKFVCTNDGENEGIAATWSEDTNSVVFDLSKVSKTTLPTFRLNAIGNGSADHLKGVSMEFKLNVAKMPDSGLVPQIRFGYYLYGSNVDTISSMIGWNHKTGVLTPYQKNIKGTDADEKVICEAGESVWFRMTNNGSDINYYVSRDGVSYSLIGSAAVADLYSTNGYFGFVFRKTGIYSISDLRVYQDQNISLVGVQEPVVEGANRLRFLSTVNSLDYKTAGFLVEVKTSSSDREAVYTTTVAYRSVLVCDGESTSTVSAESLGGQYIIALELKNLPAGDATVRITPYVVYEEADLTWYSYGKTCTVSCTDGAVND